MSKLSIRSFAVCGLFLALCGDAFAATLLSATGQTLANSDPTQTGLLNVNYNNSLGVYVMQDWSGSETFASVIDTGTLFHYRTYTIPASAIGGSRYVQIIMDDTTGYEFVSAYAGAYAPGSAGSPNYGLNTNWLGDVGFAGNFFGNDTHYFQVVVPAGMALVVVVNNTTGGALSGANSGTFNLTVESFLDTQYSDTLAIISANTTTFTVGMPGTFTVNASGYPIPTLGGSGTLPTGVTFTGATGVLAGTPAAGTVGAYPLVFTASNGVNPNAVQNFTLTVVDAPPGISSGPTATPSTAGVGQTVAFAVGAAGTDLAVTWDFGDGNGGNGTNPTHAYFATGSYTATVTVSNGAGTATGTVGVTVSAPALGTGNDTNGDGIADDVDQAWGFDLSSPNNTPLGRPLAPTDLNTLKIAVASIKLNFAKPSGMDSISFSGTMAVPAAFKPTGAKAYFLVGDVAKTLTLTAKGNAVSGGYSIKVALKTTKGVVQANPAAKYSVAFNKGTFAAKLAGAGLTNANAASVSVAVPFTFIFNAVVYQKIQPMKYTAKKGKNGSAK